mmetsp:Transcript_23085/g.91569  ORF Transcript_23085/g.91569 Transcript_23085/m.91569 type:complete len:366 (-) Transcript_23085:1342-2439(-)
MMMLVLAVLALARGVAAVVPAVTSFDATQYTGRWYQISANKLVTSTFERNAVCVTADYALDEDPTYGTIVRLVNSERTGDVQGDLSNVTGFAYAADATKPAELTVQFDPPVGAVGSYWIVKLDDEDYRYSVVSDDRSATLFVLARDVDEYAEKYAAEVDAFLDDAGFAGARAATPTVQGPGCTYAPEPAARIDALPKSALEEKTTARRSSPKSVCPKSPAFVYASCAETVTFADTPCDAVVEEIQSRVSGQYDAWHDAHNNGTYSIVAADGLSLSLERRTGDNKYTDKMNLELAADGSDCVATACSASQVMSILDYGTNYCNLHLLYCGSKDGCPFVKHDFAAYTEDIASCTDSTTPCFAAATQT